MALQELATLLEKVRTSDKQRLVQRTEWGTINFSSVAAALDSIFQISDLLSNLPLERLPPNAISELENSLKNVITWLDRNDKFDLNTNNPVSQRDEIANNLRSASDNLYTVAHLWIPFLAYLKGDIPRQLASIEEAVGKANTAYGNFEKYSVDATKAIDAAVAATKEASGKAGVGVFTKDFANDAAAHESDARDWLTRTTISAIVTVAAACATYFIPIPDAPAGIFQYASSKIIVLAMLIAVTAWCAGNYKASKHQAAVSKFKAHALQTFQAFVQATQDPTVRDAVLLETARSIFTQGATGYIGGDKSTDGASRIVEIIKGAVPGGDSSP